MKLEIKDIVKSFGDKEILHHVSFEIDSGQIMGFLGRNGAGKTTTIRCLMDVFKADSGKFLLDGKAFDPNKVRIGYLPEERGMYQKSSVLEQLIYFGMLRNASKKEATESALYWIKRFGLEEYKNKKLETLSKGNQQKIQIAQAFLNDPDILILDEPFSGLDPVNSEIFKEAIRDFKNEKKLVVFSSHQMAYVQEICDDVTIIDNGHIITSGNLSELKKQFGQNKSVIKADNYSDHELVELLKEYNPVLDQQGVIIENNTLKQSELLQLLLNKKIEVSQFTLYEPSLQDIFVKLVGDHHA